MDLSQSPPADSGLDLKAVLRSYLPLRGVEEGLELTWDLGLLVTNDVKRLLLEAALASTAYASERQPLGYMLSAFCFHLVLLSLKYSLAGGSAPPQKPRRRRHFSVAPVLVSADNGAANAGAPAAALTSGPIDSAEFAGAVAAAKGAAAAIPALAAEVEAIRAERAEVTKTLQESIDNVIRVVEHRSRSRSSSAF